MKYLIAIFCVCLAFFNSNLAQAAIVKSCKTDIAAASTLEYEPISSLEAVLATTMMYLTVDWENVPGPDAATDSLCKIEDGKFGKSKFKSYRSELEGKYPVRYRFDIDGKDNMTVFLSSSPDITSILNQTTEVNLKDKVYHLDMVSENGTVAIIQFFDGEPPYKLVKYLVGKIADGSKKSIASTGKQ